MATNSLDDLRSAAGPAPEIKKGAVQSRIDQVGNIDDLRSQVRGTSETFGGQMYSTERINPARGDIGTWPKVKAGFLDNPEDKIRQYAQARFPNDPNAINRYGVKDGKVVYLDNTGELRYEDQSFLTDVPAMVPPAIGAGIGATFGPAGAALGGGFGQSVNSMLANLMGEKQTPLGNAKDIAVEASLAAGGEKLAELAVGKENARRAYRAVTPTMMEGGRDLQRLASQMGIPLDAAQLTNSPRLKGTSHVLRMGTDEAADVFQQFDQIQDQKVVGVVQDWLDSISPVRDEVAAGSKAITESGAAIKSAKDQRAAKSGPLYEAAKLDSADPTEVIDLIDTQLDGAKGQLATTLKTIKGYLYREGEEGLEVDDSVKGLHNAKLAIDAILDKNPAQEGALDTTTKRAVIEIKENLVAVLKDSEDYAKGMAVHAENSPPVQSLQENIVGVLSQLKPIQADLVVQKLFGARTPNTIRQAREILESQNPALWQQLKGSWLEGEFLKAGKPNIEGDVINHGAKFAKTLWNPQMRLKVYAALSNEEREVFDALMKVLQATGRTPRGGSRTEFNREAKESIKDDAAPLISKGLNAIQFWNVPSRVAEWWQTASATEYSHKLAQLITSPDSLSQLKQLTRLAPGSEKSWQVIGAVMSTSANEGIQGVTRPYSGTDRLPAQQQ